MLRFTTHFLTQLGEGTRCPIKKVAIVVPLSNRSDLTDDEKLSMRHLTHYLGQYDKFLIAPRGLPVQFDGFRVKRFSPKFFGSAAAHNHLTYAPLFYKAFAEYEYIFFYHLDSLVFRDDLNHWCELDLDYIGPPWIRSADSPWVTNPRVGNGGFTLLKVESALKVLYNRYRQQPATYWLDMFSRNGKRVEPVVRALRLLLGIFPKSRILNAFIRDWEEMQDPAPHSRNNDVFWSDKASAYYPEFKIASLAQGLQFGFEAAPRKCLEMNEGKLPFGCHAWARYDRSFWEPFLLKEEAATRETPGTLRRVAEPRAT